MGVPLDQLDAAQQMKNDAFRSEKKSFDLTALKRRKKSKQEISAF